MMTCNERVTALAHLVIGVGVQMVVAGMFWLATGSWTVGAWAGATCAATLFYSRELNQAERRAADRLGVSHGELWAELSEAAPCLWPPNWDTGNRWDFYAPALAVLAVAGGVTIGGVL